MRGEYENLRLLLLDDEQQRLDGIDRRLDALPETLAESIESANRTGGASRLARALSESTTESLEVAVRRRPEAVVHAVFPVIGPAIRRALVEALRHMAHDLDQALADTLSLKVLRWRFEAWRTGVPYAQVVLRQRLHYRVEHLFLIQHQSGLLLDHLSAPGVPDIDADAVAGMLTAIAQFVHDSVRAEGAAQLGSASVGEYRLLVSDGPEARLAALVRGVPPSALATRMDELSEELQARHGKRLAAPPDTAGGLLEPNLLADLHQAQPVEGERAKPRLRWVMLALLAAALGVMSYRLWLGWQWSQQVHAVRADLMRWPGFVLLEASSSRRGELRIDGLYDPAGGDPGARWNPGTKPSGQAMHIDWSLRPYLSLEPALVARRAARVLAVDSTLINGPDAAGVLQLTGTVPFAEWYRLRHGSQMIPGVTRVDLSKLDYRGSPEISSLVARIEAARIGFDTAVAPDATAETTLQSLLGDVERLQAQAANAGISVQLHAFGLTDEPGGSLVNRDLRMRRAEWLAQRLTPVLRPPARIAVDLDTLSALEFHGITRAALIRVDLQPTGSATP
ncbi:hypothetical protein [Dyella jiangningensis]|nr:hypothetical protein [Dyella jiangningensis]